MSLTACAMCGKHPITGHTLEERRACRYARNRKWRKPPVRLPMVGVTSDTHGHTRMGGAHARKQVGRAKGGSTAHAKGTGHHWTPETARAAAASQLRWKYRCDCRNGPDHLPTCASLVKGRYLGRTSKPRPKVARAPLRAHYAAHPTEGIQWWPPPVNEWAQRTGEPGYWTHTTQYGTRRIRERTALMRLGHLPKWYRKADAQGVPLAITPLGALSKRRSKVETP